MPPIVGYSGGVPPSVTSGVPHVTKHNRSTPAPRATGRPNTERRPIEDDWS